MRPTKFHHITSSSVKGVPPSSRTRAGPPPALRRCSDELSGPSATADARAWSAHFSYQLTLRRRYALGTQQSFLPVSVTITPNALTSGFLARPTQLDVTNAQVDSFARVGQGLSLDRWLADSMAASTASINLASSSGQHA